MKKYYYIKILAFFCCISISENIYCQNKLYVGPSFGYAPGKIDMVMSPFDNPLFLMNKNHNLLIGGDIRYTLEQSIFGFDSGLKYNRKWDNKNNVYSYITAPFVLELIIGDKIFFQSGIGVYANLLLKHDLVGFEKKTSRFLYGSIINIGFGLRINDNILQFKFENYSDISDTGILKRHALAGGYDDYPYRLQVNSFSISYLIKI